MFRYKLRSIIRPVPRLACIFKGNRHKNIIVERGAFEISVLTHCACSYLVFGILCIICWLRHCATNRKVAGSIPDGVTGIFQ
jgi:hypothetical protein